MWLPKDLGIDSLLLKDQRITQQDLNRAYTRGLDLNNANDLEIRNNLDARLRQLARKGNKELKRLIKQQEKSEDPRDQVDTRVRRSTIDSELAIDTIDVTQIRSNLFDEIQEIKSEIQEAKQAEITKLLSASDEELQGKYKEIIQKASPVIKLELQLNRLEQQYHKSDEQLKTDQINELRATNSKDNRKRIKDFRKYQKARYKKWGGNVYRGAGARLGVGIGTGVAIGIGLGVGLGTGGAGLILAGAIGAAIGGGLGMFTIGPIASWYIVKRMIPRDKAKKHSKKIKEIIKERLADRQNERQREQQALVDDGNQHNQYQQQVQQLEHRMQTREDIRLSQMSLPQPPQRKLDELSQYSGPPPYNPDWDKELNGEHKKRGLNLDAHENKSEKIKKELPKEQNPKRKSSRVSL